MRALPEKGFMSSMCFWAASWGDKLAWEPRSGSLKLNRHLEPALMAFWALPGQVWAKSSLRPQSMGQNSRLVPESSYWPQL